MWHAKEYLAEGTVKAPNRRTRETIEGWLPDLPLRGASKLLFTTRVFRDGRSGKSPCPWPLLLAPCRPLRSRAAIERGARAGATTMAAQNTAGYPESVAEESYDEQLEELQDWLSAQPPSRIISPFSRASTPYEPSMELRDMSLPPSQSQSPGGPSGAVPAEAAAALPTATAPHAATHRRSASMPAHPPALLAPGALTLPPSMSGALSNPSSPRTMAREQQQREVHAPHVQVVHHHHHHHHDSSDAAKAVEIVRAPRSSLARQSGRGRSLLVTVLCLSCHALFFYAQLTGTALDCPGSGGTPCVQHFEPAGVAQGLISFHMDYEAYGALAESIGIAEKLMCAAGWGWGWGWGWG